jgi:hypothetical protein
MDGLNIYLIEFLPGIWISNTKDLNDNFIKQKKIKGILDCEKEMVFFESAENYIESIKREIKKTNHKNLFKFLLQTTELIHRTIMNAESIVIFDPHGNQKAPVLIITYLMRYGHLNPAKTVESYLSKSNIPLNIKEDYQIGIKIFYSKLQEIPP